MIRRIARWRWLRRLRPGDRVLVQVWDLHFGQWGWEPARVVSLGTIPTGQSASGATVDLGDLHVEPRWGRLETSSPERGQTVITVPLDLLCAPAGRAAPAILA